MITLPCGLVDGADLCTTPSCTGAHIRFFLLAHGTPWEKVASEIIPLRNTECAPHARPWDSSDESSLPLTVFHTVGHDSLGSHEINLRVVPIKIVDHHGLHQNIS